MSTDDYGLISAHRFAPDTDADSCSECGHAVEHPAHRYWTRRRGLRSAALLLDKHSPLYATHVRNMCPVWRRLRTIREELCESRCEHCGCTGGRDYGLAHTSYVRLGFESIDDVMFLCGTCHRRYDQRPRDETLRAAFRSTVRLRVESEHELFIGRLNAAEIVYHSQDGPATHSAQHACPLPLDWQMRFANTPFPSTDCGLRTLSDFL